MIKKQGNKWCVYDHTGKKKLGCHDTKIQAHGQLQAIEASKAAAAKGKSKKHKGMRK